MKVLIAGLYKTGTKSMEEAMRILGYRAAELEVYFGEQYDDWEKIYVGKATTEDFQRMFKDYDAAGGYIAAMHWKEFLKAFPDIKIILLEREFESWYLSYKNQMEGYNKSFLSFPLSVFSPTARRWFHFLEKFMTKLWNKEENNSFSIRKTIPILDKASSRKLHYTHREDVVKNAPQDQLLIYNVKEGWEPICKFLGFETPSRLFPHQNKNGTIVQKRLKYDPYVPKMYKEMYITLATIFVILGFVVTFVLRF